MKKKETESTSTAQSNSMVDIVVKIKEDDIYGKFFISDHHLIVQIGIDNCLFLVFLKYSPIGSVKFRFDLIVGILIENCPIYDITRGCNKTIGQCFS